MELGFSESMAEPSRSGALKRSAGSDFSSDLNMLCFSSSSSSPKTSGCYSGAAASLVNGVKGPFTPSQWLELEQQALIYKYITANAPIPAHLLVPICKALESAGFIGFNAGTLRQSTWGWGPFHLGYGGSTDPEPGRCRRTDGKKWRCSRDAVADHKYCERHMNRGRHRSRKHVEASGDAAPKPAASLPSSPAAPPGGSSNSFDLTQHYHQAKTSAVNPLINRMNASRGNQGVQHNNDAQLSFLPSINLNNTETSAFSVHKHQDNPYGFLSSYTKAAEAQPQPQHSLYPFMDEWPKAQPNHSSELHHATRLSMGLGSWESSIGGPLGEALHSKSPALNLMPTVWEGSSGGYRQSASSPTGVLQRSAVVSVSNSSAGSSPRAVESHEAALAAASRLLASD